MIRRFLYFPQNVLLGLYNAYWAPSTLSVGMKITLAALPALFNKRFVDSLTPAECLEQVRLVGARAIR